VPADVASADEAVGPPEGGMPEDEIAALKEQVAALSDQYLRKAADFENYRKRTMREKADAIDFANQSLLLDLVPVLDDFERALKAAAAAKTDAADAKSEPAAAFTALEEGVVMIESRLRSTLDNKWGLKRFVSVGEAFDPARHEALMVEKSPEITESIVKVDLIAGYTLKDRVIRPAKVKVLMP
jgi:molecular chaperone GrpE